MTIDHLFLSPHLDDAVYSCGGTIHSLAVQGQRVMVATIFAAEAPEEANLSLFAQGLHQRWADSTAEENISFASLRKDEDKKACDLVAAESIQLPFLDCVYREYNGIFPYASEESLFGDLYGDEAQLVDEIYQSLYSIPGVNSETVIYGPLAVGNHVDHQTVFAVTEKLLETHHVLFYEDYPHVREAGSLDAVLSSFPYVSVALPVPILSIDQKVSAIAAHASQLSTFWESEDTMAQEIAERWKDQHQSERFWKRRL